MATTITNPNEKRRCKHCNKQIQRGITKTGWYHTYQNGDCTFGATPSDTKVRKVAPAKNMVELVAAVRKHAIENYEHDGWDILTECWDDTQITEAISTARTINGAVKNVKNWLRDISDYRAEIQATAF